MYDLRRIGTLVATWCCAQLACCQDSTTVPAMIGSPPTREALVTWENFEQSQSKFRWAVQHFRELFPTQSVTRGDAAVKPLSEAPIDLQRELRSAEKLHGRLKRLEVDCFLVLHEGKIVIERYFHGMQPDSKHFLLSIHKSIVATVIASLIGDDKLALEATIEAYVPELAKSAHAGATVRQMLDMLSAVDYTYTSSGVGKPAFERHKESIRSSVHGPGVPLGSQRFLMTLPALDRPHGVAMRYKESDPAILIWAAERATGQRFATLAQQRLWSKIGAEADLEAVCDLFGFWTHYVSCTARDLARWGQMLAENGNCNQQSVVPGSFIEDIRKNASIDLVAEEPFVSQEWPNSGEDRTTTSRHGRPSARQVNPQ